MSWAARRNPHAIRRRPAMMRSHGCGELKASLISSTVTLCGWLHRRRDHGGLSFFDLRDRSGLAQVVFNAKKNAELHQQAKAFGPEFVLRITGTVGARPKGMRSEERRGGMVEVVAETV